MEPTDREQGVFQTGNEQYRQVRGVGKGLGKRNREVICDREKGTASHADRHVQGEGQCIKGGNLRRWELREAGVQTPQFQDPNACQTGHEGREESRSARGFAN